MTTAQHTNQEMKFCWQRGWETAEQTVPPVCGAWWCHSYWGPTSPALCTLQGTRGLWFLSHKQQDMWCQVFWRSASVSVTQSLMMVTATKACDTGNIKGLKYCSMFLIKMVSKLLEKTKFKKKRTKNPNQAVMWLIIIYWVPLFKNKKIKIIDHII